VHNPIETIRQLAEVRKMSQKFADEVASGCAAEPEPARFGVITRYPRRAEARTAAADRRRALSGNAARSKAVVLFPSRQASRLPLSFLLELPARQFR
jgi:hypothetical protein